MTPDPEKVREIAREHILASARHLYDVGRLLYSHLGTSLPGSAYVVWRDAVDAEIGAATVTVSWPDEQPAAIEVRGFADLCEAMEQLGVVFEGELRPRKDEQPRDEGDATVLAGKFESEAEWIAKVEAERDADVRAVAQAVAASSGTWIATEAAIRQLGARFADRIAELDARDGGEEA